MDEAAKAILSWERQCLDTSTRALLTFSTACKAACGGRNSSGSSFQPDLSLGFASASCSTTQLLLGRLHSLGHGGALCLMEQVIIGIGIRWGPGSPL